MAQKLSASQYNLVYREGEENIVFNTLTQGMMLLEDDYVQLMHQPEQLSPEVRERMETYGFIVKTEEEEQKMVASYQRAKHNHRSVGITVELTNACNFNCKYCYQPHEKRYLSKDSADQISNWIEARLNDGVNEVRIHWFGGEPLLNIETAYYLHNRLMALKTRYTFDYLSTMTTNGYLVDRYYASHLKHMAIAQYDITVDGIAPHHNFSRPLVSGEATFDKVIANVKHLLDSGERVNMRYNVNRLNADVTPFMTYLKEEELLGKVRLHFHRTTQFDASEEVDKFYFSTLEAYSEALKGIYEQMLANGLKLPRYASGGTNCKFDCVQQFLVNTDLELVRCTSTEPNEGSVLGRIEQGEVVPNQAVVNAKIAYTPFGKEKCIGCKVLPFCKGGCHLLQQIGEDACIPEKHFIEAYVRMLYKEATTGVSVNA